MTKEELESNFEDCFDANTRTSEGGYGADTTDRLGLWWAFDPVLSEYAKQQAIAYDQWKTENRWHSLENGFWYQTLEHPSAMPEKTYNKHHRKTPQDLYNKFIEQQNKP